MNFDLAQQRQEAHLLIDVLPEEKLFAVRTLLNVLVEPLSKTLAMAPIDEQELNSETITLIEEARVSLANGEGLSHDEVLREYGL